MGLMPSVSGGLIACGKCGKRYSNPLTHVCVVRKKNGRRQLRPRATVTLGVCGKCGKPYTNPLSHVCAVQTDYKRRKSAADRQQAAERRKAAKAKAKEAARSGPPRPRHSYETCHDKDCTRATCEAYRDGFDDGLDEGRAW